MIRKLLCTCAVALLLFSSCTTVRRTAGVAEVQAVVQQYPTVADLEVLPRAEATKTWKFKICHWGETKLCDAKPALIAELLKEKGADVLLEPQFVFSRTSYGERVLTVVGFPAKLKNFRKATPEDLEALKVNVPASKKTVYKVEGPSFLEKVKGAFKK
ncbi:MAG: hypothetical protein U0K28_03780 [Prevotellamassilia sp.]|nr:hypothetical protein [Prevotellamassilia sp.]